MSSTFQSLAFDFSYSIDADWKKREARGSESAALESLLYKITTSAAWFQYEKGFIEQAECYQPLSQFLKIPESEISSVLSAIPQLSLPEGARDLQADCPDLHFLALGNGTLDQVASLQRQMNGDQQPDIQIFASCQLGERLPHSGFIKRFLKESQLEPSQLLYVTHIPEYAAAARTAGLQTLLCPDKTQYASSVRKLYSNPMERGLSFLKGRAGHLDLETSAGKTLQDIFSQFLILDALKDESIVYLPRGSPPFNWLLDNETSHKPVYSKPACVETTSLGLSVVSHVTMDQRNEIMDQMLALRDSEGIMQVYFSNEVIRQDIGAAITALSLFNEFGRGEQLQATEDWIYETLRTRAHEYSSHYYTTPDIILFFVSRLLEKAPRLNPKFQSLLHDCVLERKAAVTDAMSLAVRLITAARCGIRDDGGIKTLIMRQNDDGSWPAGAIYHSPQSGQLCYHQGLTTAWAIQAIQLQAELSQSKKSLSKHESQRNYSHAFSWPSSSIQLFGSFLRKLFLFWF